MFSTIRRVLKEVKKEKETRKAKTLILRSDICNQLVEDLFTITDSHPNTQVIIKPLSGGEIIIKSRLIDSELYAGSELYSMPDIRQTISIAE